MRTSKEISKDLDEAYNQKALLRVALGKEKVTSSYQMMESLKEVNKEIDNLHRELIEATKKESINAPASAQDSLVTNELKRHLDYSGKKSKFQVLIKKWDNLNEKADSFMLKYGTLVATIIAIVILVVFIFIVKEPVVTEIETTTAEETTAVIEAKETEVTTLEEETIGTELIPTEYIASPLPGDLTQLPIPEDYRIAVSEADIDLMARVVMSEASNEPYDCKVAIAETIINRVLAVDKFGDTVKDVVYQKDQYSTQNNGAPNNECYQAVYEALCEQKHPSDMYYFRTGHYHYWAHKYCKIGSTYFSTESEPVEQ